MPEWSDALGVIGNAANIGAPFGVVVAELHDIGWGISPEARQHYERMVELSRERRYSEAHYQAVEDILLGVDPIDALANVVLVEEEGQGMLLSELLDESTIDFIRKRDAKSG